MIRLPEKCLRGMDDCEPLAQIEATNGESFWCVGENDGTRRDIEQDKYTVCFKSQNVDEEDHYDKRDLTHHAAVLIQALAIIEEGDSKQYHGK